jgi:hypothetical protein
MKKVTFLSGHSCIFSVTSLAARSSDSVGHATLAENRQLNSYEN